MGEYNPKHPIKNVYHDLKTYFKFFHILNSKYK